MPRKTLVDIRRSELHTHRADFWPWELPILAFIHKEQIKEVGEIDCDNRVLDPEAEFARLERRFGWDKETHEVRVRAIYGNGPLGVAKLAEAMEGHLKEQAENDGRVAAELDAAAAAAETEGAPPIDDAEQPRTRRRASS